MPFFKKKTGVLEKLDFLGKKSWKFAKLLWNTFKTRVIHRNILFHRYSIFAWTQKSFPSTIQKKVERRVFLVASLFEALVTSVLFNFQLCRSGVICSRLLASPWNCDNVGFFISASACYTFRVRLKASNPRCDPKNSNDRCVQVSKGITYYTASGQHEL